MGMFFCGFLVAVIITLIIFYFVLREPSPITPYEWLNGLFGELSKKQSPQRPHIWFYCITFHSLEPKLMYDSVTRTIYCDDKYPFEEEVLRKAFAKIIKQKCDTLVKTDLKDYYTAHFPQNF